MHRCPQLSLLTLILLATCNAFAQDVPFKEKTTPGSSVKLVHKPGQCGPEAAMLALEMERGITPSKLLERYPVMHVADQNYVSALVLCSGDQTPLHWKQAGVQINSEIDNLYSVQIPLHNYSDFVSFPGIQYIELAKPAFSRLDSVLIESGVNYVHEGSGLSREYSGQGVIVGIIDVGFDYTHPTFYDANTGEYRISRVWEQNNFLGTPPAGFSYGSEFSDEQSILSERADLTLSGHGTHVASIAVGSGGDLSHRYRGVAYNSEIVLVSLYSFEGASGNNTGVIDGLKYIFDYAESAGKPAVVNLSLGHHTGPHDGTSLADQTIDALSGPGRIVVGAVGNEGDASGFYLHFDHQFDDEKSILSYLVWPDDISAGETHVDIWGEAGVDFEVSLEIYNPRTRVQESASVVMRTSEPGVVTDGMMIDLEGDTAWYAASIEINPVNGRPNIYVRVDNSAQLNGSGVNFNDLLDNDLLMLRFRAESGRVHAYAANNFGEAFFSDLSGIGADEFIDDVRVLGGNPNYTAGELGGTANRIISVGGYTTKNTFINTADQMVSVDDIVGDQYFRTSRGPTHDGRIKPEITAPANLVAAADNSFFTEFDQLVEVDKVSKGDGSHWSYSIRRGTSAAAPVVTGVAALMLEAQPDLTPESVRDILIDNARSDDFTGTLPNNTWGNGKVEALAALSDLDQTTGTDQKQLASAVLVYPNPATHSITIEAEMRGPVQLNVVDQTGRTVFDRHLIKSGRTLRLNIPPVLSGIYILQIAHDEGYYQTRFAVVK